MNRMLEHSAHILRLSKELCTLLDQEDNYISAGAHNKIAELLPQKQSLVQLYERSARAFLEEIQRASLSDSFLKNELIETSKNLNDRIQENAKKINAARAANQKLIDIFIDALKAQQSNFQGYNHLYESFFMPRKRHKNLSVKFDRVF